MIGLLLLAMRAGLARQQPLAGVQATLNDYIEGTAIGQPDRLRQAFHPDFNLFLVASDTLRVIDGQGYISRVEPGKAYNRVAKIVSVDVENDAAAAKIEVYFPDQQRRATDYLLLLKTSQRWQIIHKVIHLNTFSNAETLQVNNPDELPAIRQALYDYMDGTAHSKPQPLARAFRPDFNLYYIKSGAVTVINGQQYLNNFNEGKSYNRIGKILSVDFEGDAALAKLQILMPDRDRIAIDYLLLLKLNGQWKIVHKSFTTKQYQ